MDKRGSRGVNNGEEIEKDAVCLQIYSTSTANNLPRKLLKGVETSKQDNCYWL